MKCNIGDVVMLKTGVYPITVVDCDSNIVQCQWLDYHGVKHEDEFNIKTLFNPIKKGIFDNFNSPADSLLSYDYEYRNIGCYAIIFNSDNNDDEDFDDEYDEVDKRVNRFSIGSVVRFSSYHAYMTVEEIRDRDIVCIWFNKQGYLKREIFNQDTLVMFDFNTGDSVLNFE